MQIILILILSILPCYAKTDLYLDPSTGQTVLGEWDKDGDSFFDYTNGELRLGDRDNDLLLPSLMDSDRGPNLLLPLGDDE